MHHNCLGVTAHLVNFVRICHTTSCDLNVILRAVFLIKKTRINLLHKLHEGAIYPLNIVILPERILVKTEIIAPQNATSIIPEGTRNLLNNIRPQWQAKKLVQRVHKLMDVDPSSACQRLLNAAIHDLRAKVIVAGIDIAGEAAKQHKLPPISKNEDVQNYSTAKLIDLAFRMGLFNRAEWRRVSRCYEIRRDLEHEDDEYEASIEDCLYIFKNCIEVILAKDPIEIIRVSDIKEIIEQAETVAPDITLIEEFEVAPQPRQEEILKLLISKTLDKDQSDLIQQNAFIVISFLKNHAKQATLVTIGAHLQKKFGRTITERQARVAYAVGAYPYLRQSARKKFWAEFYSKMDDISYHWSSHGSHGELLRSFIELGGFEACPKEERKPILKWMVLAYLGKRGGVTSYGNIRNVYYSNAAAPLIRQIFKEQGSIIESDFRALKSKKIKKLRENPHIAKRYEKLLDIFDTIEN